MDRFFSKLDLRDIKIKPEGNRYLPEDDEIEPSTYAESDFEDSVEIAQTASATVTDTVEEPYVFDPIEEPSSAWETETLVVEPPMEPVGYNGHDVHAPTATIAAAPPATASTNDPNEVLKVSAKSRPSAVAGAIAGVVRECGHAEVQAIGAGATNQAVKAVAIARDYLLETGIDAICVPAFIDITIDDEERTAIRLLVEVR